MAIAWRPCSTCASAARGSSRCATASRSRAAPAAGTRSAPVARVRLALFARRGARAILRVRAIDLVGNETTSGFVLPG